MKKIKSPLNYLGNKSRILNNIIELVPKDIDYFYDVCSGSGIVGLSAPAKNIFLNDINFWTIELLKYFKNNDFETIINNTLNIIKKYNLSCSYLYGRKKYQIVKNEGFSKINKENFNKVKRKFNENKKIEYLFVLIIYGFNHYIRFNKNNEFNIPVGKTDFYPGFEKIIKEYHLMFRNKEVHISNKSIFELDFIKQQNEKSLFYFDPPYLITNAPYNSTWNEKEEIKLLKLIDKYDSLGKKIMLSNVIKSNGKINEILHKWIEKNNYKVIYFNRNYINSNYRKKEKFNSQEILIINF